MDQANIVIINVRSLGMPRLEVDTNEQKRYIVNLLEFSSVYCFPKSQEAWEDISITAHGFNLTWGTRFELHVHQLIDCAESVEALKLQA